MIKQAVGLVLTLLVVFGLSLLLVPVVGIIIGILNEFIKNV
jgi:hypothetical protein